MPQPQLLSECLTDKDILHVLMVCGAEIRRAFFESVEDVSFKGLDQQRSSGRAGSLNRFEDLRHGRIPEIAA